MSEVGHEMHGVGAPPSISPQNEARISGSALGLIKEQSIRGGSETRPNLLNT